MILRLVTFMVGGNEEPSIGALVDDNILDLQTLAASQPELPDYRPEYGLAEALGNQQWLDWARQAAEAAPPELLYPCSGVRLLAPVPVPGKIFCLAGNFAEHIAEAVEMGQQMAAQREEMGAPRVFMKPSPDTVIGDGEPIILSRTSNFVDYEAEMAVVMGKAGSHIPAEEALDYVGGICAFNDVSERKLEAHGGEAATEWDHFFDWLNGKWFNCFAPMGPCVVPLSDVPDLDNLSLRLYLNDELKQDANTGQMIFKVAETVAYISSIVTLRPGDVIATGTPSGIGLPQDIQLQDGDVVRVELEVVGSLTNPVTAEV